jgi:hypothetical protein
MTPAHASAAIAAVDRELAAAQTAQVQMESDCFRMFTLCRECLVPHHVPCGLNAALL